ncbi:MAG: hypothetical protein J7J98_02500 [candidate division Zixibacteria bacterium]|nr:hypothetical protein [candidate division Zixibacteria bacterium]
MKNCLAIAACVLLMLSLFACGQQETKEPDPGAAGQAEEVADTTRLDSAVIEVVDSAAEVVEGVVEEAVEKVQEGH